MRGEAWPMISLSVMSKQMTSQPIKHRLGETYHEVHWSNQLLLGLLSYVFLNFFYCCQTSLKILILPMASSVAISWSTDFFGFLYYLRSWLNLDGSIWCHLGMSPVPSTHWPLLNPDGLQISHMPLSTPTNQQNSPLTAFLALGHKLLRRTFERIVYSSHFIVL